MTIVCVREGEREGDTEINIQTFKPKRGICVGEAQDRLGLD